MEGTWQIEGMGEMTGGGEAARGKSWEEEGRGEGTRTVMPGVHMVRGAVDAQGGLSLEEHFRAHRGQHVLEAGGEGMGEGSCGGGRREGDRGVGQVSGEAEKMGKRA